MLRRSRQRSKTEIILFMLRSTHNRTGTKISQIMYETYIPYNQSKRVLDYDDSKQANHVYQRENI